jgi:hypothetical protein
LSKSTLVRLVPHEFVSESSDADREVDDENVSNLSHPLIANCSPSFAFGRAIGMRCRYRAENLDQKKPKPFRSHIDQSRPSRARPNATRNGCRPSFDNIRTIFGENAPLSKKATGSLSSAQRDAIEVPLRCGLHIGKMREVLARHKFGSMDWDPGTTLGWAESGMPSAGRRKRFSGRDRNRQASPRARLR